MTKKELDYESWETPTETSKQAKELKEEKGLNTHTHCSNTQWSSQEVDLHSAVVKIYTQDRNRDTYIENRLVDIAREGEGGMNWESSIKTYITICKTYA